MRTDRSVINVIEIKIFWIFNQSQIFLFPVKLTWCHRFLFDYRADTFVPRLITENRDKQRLMQGNWFGIDFVTPHVLTLSDQLFTISPGRFFKFHSFLTAVPAKLEKEKQNRHQKHDKPDTEHSWQVCQRQSRFLLLRCLILCESHVNVVWCQFLHQSKLLEQRNLLTELVGDEMISLKVKHQLVGQESFICNAVGEVFVVDWVDIKHLGHVREHDAFEWWI